MSIKCIFYCVTIRYNKYKKTEPLIMARKVDERLPEEFFIQLLTEKANIIKDHLRNRHSKLTLVANIAPTMATFKLYDLSKDDSLQIHVTLSNLGDIDEQIHQLWQQVNFLLKQYCSHCQNQRTKNGT